tara:strand:+ start:591 stop:914 length:324 start_codon:yes stop_codon:yes gene_type:complete
MYKERLQIFDDIVELCPGIERKGKTMPYTSANGYMFSLLNKDAELGFRFHKEDCKIFMEKHQTGIFKSHGAIMKDYVLIPENMLQEKELLADYLNKSFKYVMSLPPK